MDDQTMRCDYPKNNPDLARNQLFKVDPAVKTTLKLI